MRRSRRRSSQPPRSIRKTKTPQMLRIVDPRFLGNPLWTWEFHPSRLRICLGVPPLKMRNPLESDSLKPRFFLCEAAVTGPEEPEGGATAAAEPPETPPPFTPEERERTSRKQTRGLWADSSQQQQSVDDDIDVCVCVCVCSLACLIVLLLLIFVLALFLLSLLSLLLLLLLKFCFAEEEAELVERIRREVRQARRIPCSADARSYQGGSHLSTSLRRGNHLSTSYQGELLVYLSYQGEPLVYLS